MKHVPIIDLQPWFDGTPAGRTAVAEAVDEALSRVGFLLVRGHGVDPALPTSLRSRAREFFALPPATKRRYATTVSGRGWLPPGAESNAYADAYDEEGAGPADLKESFAAGSDVRTGDATIDDYWHQDNVWPCEVPALQPAMVDYMAAMRRLGDELLTICAVALGRREDFFTRHTSRSTFTTNLNWYPPLTAVGQVDGAFRIGPHTDFGTVTILDREPGAGGLQVWTDQDGWQDAPYEPGALTINTGDLLARWTGERWKSNRHRVLPPPQAHPDEDLVSLVFFYECDADTGVQPLQPPVGRVAGLEPVVAGEFIKQRLDAITVG